MRVKYFVLVFYFEMGVQLVNSDTVLTHQTWLTKSKLTEGVERERERERERELETLLCGNTLWGKYLRTGTALAKSVELQ